MALGAVVPDMELSSDQQNDATEPVLRVLYQAGVALSPDSVAANLDAYAEASQGPAAVEEALSGLADAGVVRRLDREGEYYELTGRGADYVEAEVDREAFGFID